MFADRHVLARMVKEIERHHHSNTESCKNLEQKFVFQIGTLINERFHSTNLFMFLTVAMFLPAPPTSST